MENQEKAQPELSLTDLQNIRTIIDIASKRGAFHAAEMTAVGGTFDRLNTFLNSVAAQNTENQPAEPEAAA